MTSFQLSVTPSRRAAARFVTHVRRSIQKALAEEPGIKQTDIARAIGVHRSVINREIRGYKDLTLSRVAELAWALGRDPIFDLAVPVKRDGDNHAPMIPGAQTAIIGEVKVASTQPNGESDPDVEDQTAYYSPPLKLRAAYEIA